MDKIIELWHAGSQLEKSTFVIVAMAFVYYVFRYIFLVRLERLTAKTQNDLDDRLVMFVKKFLWIIALFSTIALVLKVNGIEISAMMAGAGIFAAGLIFAAKETLADILSGIFLIADRPIRVGDRIKIDRIGSHWGSWGDVVDIGLRRTQIRNTDGVIVNYPNSVLSNTVIKNFSFEPEPVRVRVRFQVDYSADLQLTKALAIEAIQSVDAVLPDSVSVVIRSLWDDNRGLTSAGVLFEGRYRIEDVRHRTVIRSEVLSNILTQLKQNNIPLAMQPIQLMNNDE